MLGYILTFSGLLVMVTAAYSTYSVFTGRSTAFNLFSFEGISLPLDAIMGPEFAAAGQTANVELFPAQILNSTTNTLAHLFLMGFIVTVGGKIAMLGVNLLRPIIVKIDEKKIASVLDPK